MAALRDGGRGSGASGRGERADRATDPDGGAVIGEVMSAMTAGERLAYRYGASLCRQIEAEHGRARLVGSVLQPDLFQL